MSEAEEISQRCPAVTKSGRICGGKPVQGTCRCFAHAPESVEWRRKGGKASGSLARARKAIPAGMQPVLDSLLDSMHRIRVGGLQPGVAKALAAIASAYIKGFEVVIAMMRAEANKN